MNPNTSPDFLITLAERLGWALLHSLWQGALIAAVIAIALRCSRKCRAATRHAVCMIGLIAFAASVAGSAWRMNAVTISAPGSPLAAEIAAPRTTLDPLESASLVSSEKTSSLTPALNAPIGATRSWRENFAMLLPWISAAWMLGVALLTARHCIGWQRLRAMRCNGSNARPELQRTFTRLLERFGRAAGVRLVESAEAAVPMLAGLFKPVVLLPLRVISGLSEREIEAILAHELAHLARRDAWSNLAQVAIETLFFYHPAIWWIGRCARQERENAADDLALEICADRRVYVGALAQLAELRLDSQSALAATGGSLLARIQRIVRPAQVESPTGGWSLGLPALLTALALAAIFHAQADDAKPADVVAKPNDKEVAQKAATEAKAWIADAFQLDDPAKRAAAIERIRATMTGENTDEARAGVTAFVQLGPIEFDKASFRPAVRALLASSDAATRGAAASAFTMTGADPEDLPRIFALADDAAAEVRDRLTGVIVQLKKHDVRDKAASDAILKLMANLPRDSRSVAHAMWGVKLSPEIEAKVLEFCQDIDQASNGSVGYNFFYGTLSTQANKSEASCKRLIELLAHPDTTNIAGRSAWGLQQGVDRAQFGLVAEAMMKMIEARSVPYLRNNALRNLRAYGNAAQAPAIKALLAKPGATGDMRKDFEETLAALEARPLEKISTEANQTKLNVNADGSILLNGKVISLEGLATKLNALTKLDADHSVLIYGDPATDYKLINDTLSICRGANVQKVVFGSKPAAAATSAETRPANTGEDKRKEDAARLVEKNRQAARVRAAEDKQRYTFEQLGEIETLYQVANTKGKRSPEAKESLKQLLGKYGEANRTGCATLYLGQASEGAERLEYLSRAVEKFSDCYYFNGCQVGGYGRFVLALTLWDKGEKDKARSLFGELKTTYKDGTDHNGRPMGEVAEAAEKELAAKQ